MTNTAFKDAETQTEYQPMDLVSSRILKQFSLGN
jgi:hypothetical protein